MQPNKIINDVNYFVTVITIATIDKTAIGKKTPGLQYSTISINVIEE